MLHSTSALRSPIKSSFIALALASTLAVSISAQAQGVPSVMPYQGFLNDGTGVPVTGSVNITFKLYEELISDAPVWEERVDNVNVNAGAFSVNLGTVSTNLRDYVYTGRAQYIGVSINEGPELSPRTQLGSLPYAFLAYNASRLEGRAAADFVTQEEFTIFQNTVVGGLDADDVNALIDARGYLNAGAITALVNGLIAQGNYLSAAEINALINTAVATINTRIDGLQTQVTTMQGQVTTMQGQITELQTAIQALQNQGSAPFILGPSSTSSNGKFEFGGEQGVRAAGEMCRATFPNDPTAHYCSLGEIQSALSVGNFPANINNVETWVFPSWIAINNGNNFEGDNDFCQSLLYNSAHAAQGTAMTVLTNANSTSNGTGIRIAFNHNRSCQNALQVMCCR